MTDTPDILKTIIAHKREEVAAARLAASVDELKVRISDLEDTPRGFERHLREAVASDWTAIIAEIKKGSPSKGIIREDFDPLEIAEIYQNNGATCLSVLTEEKFFMGHLRFLALIREQVGLPLLRKDFIIDPWQVYEARAAGADAILLIASLLEQQQIIDLAGVAREIHLDVLLEVHDEQEMAVACTTDIGLIGVNNRNLRTFVTDLATTERLSKMLPAGRLLVSESGINNCSDIKRLHAAGASAFLIGEAMMREDDIGAKLQELLG
jgi:indole-3-glycerol phosphate synthase